MDRRYFFTCFGLKRIKILINSSKLRNKVENLINVLNEYNDIIIEVTFMDKEPWNSNMKEGAIYK